MPRKKNRTSQKNYKKAREKKFRKKMMYIIPHQKVLTIRKANLNGKFEKCQNSQSFQCLTNKITSDQILLRTRRAQGVPKK